MTNPHLTAPRLVTGMRMTREEFLRVWEEIPELKCAELIDGVVYVASPVGSLHSDVDVVFHGWLLLYQFRTPGCLAGCNATWHMLDDAPQPDAHLRISEEFGGMSRVEGGRFAGAPELAVEVCQSATRTEWRLKLALYRKAGVREYINADVSRRRIEWLALNPAGDAAIEPSADGILKSRAFPGLWLDAAAFWEQDGARLLRTLDQGIATPEHAAFVDSLRQRRQP